MVFKEPDETANPTDILPVAHEHLCLAKRSTVVRSTSDNAMRRIRSQWVKCLTVAAYGTRDVVPPIVSRNRATASFIPRSVPDTADRFCNLRLEKVILSSQLDNERADNYAE